MAARWKAVKARIHGVKLRTGGILRDPRDVAWRWLRRFVGGYWYRGGNHVARLDCGPGIGFEGFVNDRAKPIKAILTHERRAA